MTTPPVVLSAIAACYRDEHAAVREVIAEAKSGQPCADCGRADVPSRELHFHHLDPATKLYPVPRATTPAAARREIAKCILLCSSCHRARHRSVSPVESRTGENGTQLSEPVSLD